MSAFKAVIAPVNKAGWPFIAAFAAVSAGLFLVWQPLGWLGLLLVAFTAYFFRDPRRVVPIGPGLVVSPGDGFVSAIVPAAPPPELGIGDRPLTRISIFLSVFDVHINRIPADGVAERVVYTPGKFLNASLDKASTDNERTAVLLRTEDGRQLVFAQIAGLIARRIICHLKDGQTVRGGERYGLIRFGSRCDVYLPDGVAPLVAAGQHVIGGETILADLHSNAPARMGEVR